jgi:hypothetical protein
MPNEFSRNIQDADLTKARLLTSADGNVTSPDLDLGTNSKGFLTEEHELEVLIPALTATQLASADTLTILLQGGSAVTPTTSLNISAVLTGTGSAIPQTSFRFRLPANCPRYVNAKFTTAGTTGDMSAVSASVRLLT